MMRWFATLFGGIWFTVGAALLAVGLVLDLLQIGKQGQLGLILMLVGGLFALPGGIIAGFGLRSMLRSRRLRSVGMPVMARVTGAEMSNVRYNGVVQCCLLFQYVDTAGQTRSGRSDLMPPYHAKQYQPGEEVEIRVDPSRGENYAWVGKPLDKSANALIWSK